ncbi:hypothetical protein [Nocardia brasiliensis]|uniref:hypothetical protein n=1 Tax=Nocardia brasiliensis TaxID=37326 RepID=UPI002457B10F|nr:hypothetical protein [Nocardia brasiliensis]
MRRVDEFAVEGPDRDAPQRQLRAIIGARSRLGDDRPPRLRPATRSFADRSTTIPPRLRLSLTRRQIICDSSQNQTDLFLTDMLSIAYFNAVTASDPPHRPADKMPGSYIPCSPAVQLGYIFHRHGGIRPESQKNGSFFFREQGRWRDFLYRCQISIGQCPARHTMLLQHRTEPPVIDVDFDTE